MVLKILLHSLFSFENEKMQNPAFTFFDKSSVKTTTSPWIFLTGNKIRRGTCKTKKVSKTPERHMKSVHLENVFRV